MKLKIQMTNDIIGIIPYNEIYKIYKVKNNAEKNKFINQLFTEYDNVYRWDGVGEPQIPIINPNAGEITDWNIDNQNKVKDFLNNYLDVIIQENIRVQQGGNPDYESPIVGTQRIIFDFEIVNESLWKNSFKSIYRMILTIDKSNNIIAGSLELFHNWKYADEPVKNQKGLYVLFKGFN